MDWTRVSLASFPLPPPPLPLPLLREAQTAAARGTGERGGGGDGGGEAAAAAAAGGDGGGGERGVEDGEALRQRRRLRDARHLRHPAHRHGQGTGRCASSSSLGSEVGDGIGVLGWVGLLARGGGLGSVVMEGDLVGSCVGVGWI